MTRTHLFALFQQLDCHVSRSGANFQDRVCGAESGLVYHALNNERVLENVLAKVGVESEPLNCQHQQHNLQMIDIP